MKTYFCICLVAIGLFSSLVIIDANGETIKSVQLQIGGLSNVYLGDFDFDGDVDFNDFIAFSNQYGRDQYDLDKIVIWAPKEADTGGELERNKWLYRFMGYWEISNYFWGTNKDGSPKDRDVINISQLSFYQPGYAVALGVKRTVGSDVYFTHPKTADGRLDPSLSMVYIDVEQQIINEKPEYVYVLTLKGSGPGVIRLYIQFEETLDSRAAEKFNGYPTLEVLPQIIEQKCFDLTEYDNSAEYVFYGNRTLGLKQVTCGERPVEIREISRQDFFRLAEKQMIR